MYSTYKNNDVKNHKLLFAKYDILQSLYIANRRKLLHCVDIAVTLQYMVSDGAITNLADRGSSLSGKSSKD